MSVVWLTGCTSYEVSVRTFPPDKAEVYVDGERLGQTDAEGRASVSTGKRSIFAEPLLEIRKNGQRARMKLGYAQAGTKIQNVVRAVRREEPFERFYEVTVAFAANPLPPFTKEITGGRNRFRVSNPNDFVVWAGVRSLGKGTDFIVFENASETVDLPDGQYEVYFAYSTKPDTLVKGESIWLWGGTSASEIIKAADGK
jgi:hypothetical protein